MVRRLSSGEKQPSDVLQSCDQPSICPGRATISEYSLQLTPRGRANEQRQKYTSHNPSFRMDAKFIGLRWCRHFLLQFENSYFQTSPNIFWFMAYNIAYTFEGNHIIIWMLSQYIGHTAIYTSESQAIYNIVWIDVALVSGMMVQSKFTL